MYVFKAYPCGSMYQNFILFYGLVNILLYGYSTFSLFLPPLMNIWIISIVNSAAKNIHVQVFA